MGRSRFNEEQIIGILREQEAGVKTAVVCRKHGMSDATFYRHDRGSNPDTNRFHKGFFELDIKVVAIE